ncbi:SRPBCC domain-containing protein, partial [Candidatus Saccharibacteria bacterium]|nr:SRPBCC domain-containing protein [Candidatus Saccharibacteria bacterium]
MSEVKVTKDLENCKLIIEYTANGPKDKVWKAYADKDWFEKWWGPEGWETTAKEFNFAPGG